MALIRGKWGGNGRWPIGSSSALSHGRGPTDGDAAEVVEILEEWMSWAQNAKPHITILENRKVEFCFATVLMTLVQEAARSTKKAGADMIECLKLWRKVRLG
jgi:hypothetical protein